MPRKKKNLTSQTKIQKKIHGLTYKGKGMRIGGKVAKALKKFINEEDLDPAQITKAAANNARHAKRLTIKMADVKLLKTLL